MGFDHVKIHALSDGAGTSSTPRGEGEKESENGAISE